MKITKLVTNNDIEVPVGKFTVLVGPNNVGKSQTLKDIHQKLTNGPGARSTIVKAVEIEKPANFDALLAGLVVVDDPQNIDHHLIRGIGSNLASGENIRVHLPSLKNQFENATNLDFTFGNISKFRVSYLDAESRLNVTKVTGAHNPHTQAPQNLLQGLFGAEASVEETLRNAFRETFSTDLRLDYSGMTQLAIRVAKEFGEIPEDPRKAYPLFSKFDRLDEQGDGFRSFVGVVLSLLLSEGRIILLDEPEAFLHPAQARQLGYWIANRVGQVQSQVLVATHNANFLSGILASNQPVDIFRINRKNDLTTYGRITPEATSKLATSPVLSSQRVLEAIFYRGVVVCEADADRSIYQTVATRELNKQDILFIHAHNKQTIPQVASLLRDTQIPTCAITDLDILNSSTDLQLLLESTNTNADIETILFLRDEIEKGLNQYSETSALDNIKNKVAEFLQQLAHNEHTLSGARGALNRIQKEATKWYPVKLEGLDGFPEGIKELAEKLILIAKQQGAFLVPVGELEGWLDLGTKRKNKWIILALEALYSDQCSERLRQFVSDVISYLESEAVNNLNPAAAEHPRR